MDYKMFPVWSLVLGILAFCGLNLWGAVPAWVLGNMARKQFDGGGYSESQVSMAKAGRILGIVGTCVFGVGIVFAFIVMALFLPLVKMISGLAAGESVLIFLKATMVGLL